MQEITLERRAAADANEVLELLVTVFDDTSRAWFEAKIIDPPYPESVGFVARAEGRIVSHVELLDMPLRYGEGVLHIGAVSGVATLPEWRRRGLASALMQLLIAEMTARQMPALPPADRQPALLRAAGLDRLAAAGASAWAGKRRGRRSVRR